MQITYPSHHCWLVDISSGLDSCFSGRVAKKINSTLPLLAQANITYKIEPLHETFFDDFSPLYTDHIGAKKNALIHNIKEKTLYNETGKFPYYCLTLRERGLFLGGVIFSLRSDRVSYAYRSFINEWQEAKLKAGPALISEYAVAQFACEKGLQFISHGKDRNPYGLNAAIGLATFKMSVGCLPTIGGKFEVKTLDTSNLTQDCLILEQPKSGSSITKAYLVTLPETEDKYLRSTKYPDQLEVQVIHRNN